jgi:hypothetical protein
MKPKYKHRWEELVFFIFLSLPSSYADEPLFSERFEKPEAAEERFIVEKNGEFGSSSFEEGKLKIGAVTSNFTSVRNNINNDFSDNGEKPLTYSCKKTVLENAPSFTRLWIRLNETGYRDGYCVQHFFDGTVSTLTLMRYTNGVPEILYDSGTNPFIESSSYDTAVFALSVFTAKDTVKFKIHYTEKVIEAEDSSELRIKEGHGMGFTFGNHGNPAQGSKDASVEISEIQVTESPEFKAAE